MTSVFLIQEPERRHTGETETENDSETDTLETRRETSSIRVKERNYKSKSAKKKYPV